MPRKKTKKKKVKRIKLKKKIYRKKVKANQIEKRKFKQENISRISKNNEQKIEIIKIKKQATEKKLFKIKDYIVYPKHGVGQILSVGSKIIGGIEVQCYDIKFEKDKAIGLLPINKQSHLRPLSSINQINKAIGILKGKPKIKRTMWSRRAQEYEQKIVSGKIYDLAEVVRDLNKGNDILVDQSYSERQLLEKAYDRILTEFQIVLGTTLEQTQKKLDKALKRNPTTEQ
jgi:CarD family transcriptional regulator|tara:strand:- start:2148 stop:2834 length:687 start_codon:yes stop_codon:yes gene_type:complete